MIPRLSGALAVAITLVFAGAADAKDFKRSGVTSKKGQYSRSRPPAGLESRYKSFCRGASSACRGSYANDKHKFLIEKNRTRRRNTVDPDTAPVERSGGR